MIVLNDSVDLDRDNTICRPSVVDYSGDSSMLRRSMVEVSDAGQDTSGSEGIKFDYFNLNFGVNSGVYSNRVDSNVGVNEMHNECA